MSAPLLALDHVTMQFGGLKAVSDFDFALEPGELAGLIGPNGAGKTTVFNVITGVYKPTSGTVRFQGETISGLRPHKIAHKVITRTFQNIRLFSSRCCRDNLCIAAHHHARTGLAAVGVSIAIAAWAARRDRVPSARHLPPSRCPRRSRRRCSRRKRSPSPPPTSSSTGRWKAAWSAGCRGSRRS